MKEGPGENEAMGGRDKCKGPEATLAHILAVQEAAWLEQGE